MFANAPTLTGTTNAASLLLSGTLGVTGTSTLATTSISALTVNSQTFTDLTGSGLSLVNGTLTVATSTFDLDPNVLNLAQGNILVGDASGNAIATSSLFVASDGNVGIGTTSPTGRLTVSSENAPETWEQVGSGLSVAVADPGVARLSPNRIALASNDVDLSAYEFDGTAWSQVGTPIDLGTVVNPSVTALSENRVAIIENINDTLTVYEFDGATWSQVGSGLVITGQVGPGITALSPESHRLYRSRNRRTSHI